MENYTSKLSNLLSSYDITPPRTGSSTINVGKNERMMSAAGGAMLLYLSRKSKGLLGKTMSLAGGTLLMRGATGFCPVSKMVGRDTAIKESRAIDVTSRITINKPRNEVYAYWRDLENLPKFMKHVEEVKPIDATHSYWTIHIPGGMGTTLEWEAEITHEDENQRLAWQSLPEADIDNAGEVQFSDAADGEGTDVQAFISYRAPEGDAGSKIAELLNPAFKKMIKQDLRRFKAHLDTTGIPTE